MLDHQSLLKSKASEFGRTQSLSHLIQLSMWILAVGDGCFFGWLSTLKIILLMAHFVNFVHIQYMFFLNSSP